MSTNPREKDSTLIGKSVSNPLPLSSLFYVLCSNVPEDGKKETILSLSKNATNIG